MVVHKKEINWSIDKNNDKCCDILDVTINPREGKTVLMLIVVYVDVADNVRNNTIKQAMERRLEQIDSEDTLMMLGDFMVILALLAHKR